MPEPQCEHCRLVRWLATVLLAVLASVPVSTNAATVLELLGDATGARSFGARTVPTGVSATYFNPALLPDIGTRLDAGLVFLNQVIDIDLEPRPAGVDVSKAIYRARRVTADGTARLEARPLPTADIRSTRGSFDPSRWELYGSVGASHVFGPWDAWEGEIALGLFAMFPLRVLQAQRPFYVDEREQYFSNSLRVERLEDRTAVLHLALGLGVRPVRWLSLGVGVAITPEARTTTRMFVADASSYEIGQLAPDVDLVTGVVPHFGLAVEPIPPLRITATVHLERSTRVEGHSDIQIWDFPYEEETEPALEQDFLFDYAFEPLRVGAGVAWTDDGAPALGWSASAQVLWSRWSTYRDRQAERPRDAWSDTFAVSVGGSLRVAAHVIGLDLAWEPSPVPPQRGRDNYVDNTRIALSAGWQTSVPVAGLQLELGAQMQLHWLLARSVTKSADAGHPVVDEFPDSVDAETNLPIPESAGLQTNNPGFPGFASEGWLLSIGLRAGLRF